eukprot:TRINITY_DN1221_c0_g1_i2.p1 TRINITY_DN1221_c0_g1~~TRINITY_DN1221_c0_g1_i2.p1  ORF type:complete len:159 (+),score=31.06 TRINITY_DN1221_c0_g1_i2:72-548(+)
MANNCSISSARFENETETQNIVGKLNFGNVKFTTFNRIGETSYALEYSFTKEEVGTSDESWNKLLSVLPPKECRVGLYNLDYTSESDGVTRSKLILLNWVPSEANVKSKMLSATNVKALKAKFESFGLHIFMVIQGGSPFDLERSDVVQKVLSRCTVK